MSHTTFYYFLYHYPLSFFVTFSLCQVTYFINDIFINIIFFHLAWLHASINIGRKRQIQSETFSKIFLYLNIRQQVEVTIKPHLEVNHVLAERQRTLKNTEMLAFIFVKIWSCFYAKHAFSPSIYMAETDTYSRKKTSDR